MRGGIVAVAVTVVLIGLVAAVQFRPTVEYGPSQGDAQVGTRGESPAQIVEQLLWSETRLPPPGTGVVRREGALRWETPPAPVAPPVTAVALQRVRVRASQALLEALLDDDPVFRAEVEVLVTTADGRKTALRFELWDYGLLLPWGLRSIGDGLKPGGVRWGTRP